MSVEGSAIAHVVSMAVLLRVLAQAVPITLLYPPPCCHDPGLALEHLISLSAAFQLVFPTEPELASRDLTLTVFTLLKKIERESYLRGTQSLGAVEQQSAEIASWQAAIQPQKSTGELLETNSCGISSDAFFPKFFFSPNPQLRWASTSRPPSQCSSLWHTT